ncbi:MAG: hypothetical protein ACHP7P_12515 [Terriglobales bacterium]
MKGTVVSNDGEVAVVQLENGLRLACPRERSMDYNEVSLRTLSRGEFLQDMAVGAVKDGWAPQDANSPIPGVQPVVKKLYDAENSEWAFRLTIQIFNLSAAVLHRPEEQRAFREVHAPLFDSMRECYDAQLELNRFIEKHLQDVAAGRCVEVTNGHLTLLEDIEPKLNRLFKDFFVKARTVLYHLFGQELRKKSHRKPRKSVTEVLLGHDLSFVQLGDDAKFDEKAQEFLQKVPGEAAKGLIDMLRGDRKAWSSGLIDIRDTIIHDVTCPQLKMRYVAIEGVPRVAFPTVQKTELREFVRLFWDNLCGAVEETIVSCFNIKLSPLFVMYRLAEGARDPQCPMRYQVAMRPANIPPGVIVGPPPKVS